MNISITLDVDWAHDAVIDDTLSLLEKYSVNATFFSTHYTTTLENLNDKKYEIGIHPNFNFLLSGQARSAKSILEEMMVLYPNALGMRSHSLTQSSLILDYAKESGIMYDSNIFHPKQPLPFRDYSGLVRLSHCWVDLGLLIDKHKFMIDSLPLNKCSNNILDFHPIHIFLNTPTVDFYEKAKTYGRDIEGLYAYRNTKIPGLRDLFIAVLSLIREKKYSSKLLKDLAEEFVS